MILHLVILQYLEERMAEINVGNLIKSQVQSSLTLEYVHCARLDLKWEKEIPQGHRVQSRILL